MRAAHPRTHASRHSTPTKGAVRLVTLRLSKIHGGGKGEFFFTSMSVFAIGGDLSPWRRLSYIEVQRMMMSVCSLTVRDDDRQHGGGSDNSTRDSMRLHERNKQLHQELATLQHRMGQLHDENAKLKKRIEDLGQCIDHDDLITVYKTKIKLLEQDVYNGNVAREQSSERVRELEKELDSTKAMLENLQRQEMSMYAHRRAMSLQNYEQQYYQKVYGNEGRFVGQDSGQLYDDDNVAGEDVVDTPSDNWLNCAVCDKAFTLEDHADMIKHLELCAN